MFEQKPGSLRHVGVKLAEYQSTEQAPAMTLVSLADLDFKLAVWGDESGRKHEAVVAVVQTIDGPRMLLPPNSESWTVALKPFVEALQKQFREKMAAREAQQNPQVPEKDAVDVTE